MNSILVKKFGFLCSFFVFSGFCINASRNYKFSGDFYGNKINILVLIISMILLLSSFIRIGKIVQVVCISIVCLLTFYDDPEQSLGFVHIVLFTFVAHSYGFLRRFFFTKIVCSVIVISSVVLISSFMQGVNILNVIPSLFLIILIVITARFFIFDELSAYIKRENKLKDENEMLKSYLEHARQYIDPVNAGLTNAELILLEKLCIYRESNIDLGIRLAKSPNTVKVQLTKIMIKIGAESRYQLIDLCRNYFITIPS